MSRLIPSLPRSRAASRDPQYRSMNEVLSPDFEAEKGRSIEMLTSWLPSLTNKSSRMPSSSSALPFFSDGNAITLVSSGLVSGVGSSTWTVRPSHRTGSRGILRSCLRVILSEVIRLIFLIDSLDTPYFLAMPSRSSYHLTLWMKYPSSVCFAAAFFASSSLAAFSSSAFSLAAASFAAFSCAAFSLAAASCAAFS